MRSNIRGILFIAATIIGLWGLLFILNRRKPDRSRGLIILRPIYITNQNGTIDVIPVGAVESASRLKNSRWRPAP
jgi:hypothetical protein